MFTTKKEQALVALVVLLFGGVGVSSTLSRKATAEVARLEAEYSSAYNEKLATQTLIDDELKRLGSTSDGDLTEKVELISLEKTKLEQKVELYLSNIRESLRLRLAGHTADAENLVAKTGDMFVKSTPTLSDPLRSPDWTIRHAVTYGTTGDTFTGAVLIEDAGGNLVTTIKLGIDARTGKLIGQKVLSTKTYPELSTEAKAEDSAQARVEGLKQARRLYAMTEEERAAERSKSQGGGVFGVVDYELEAIQAGRAWYDYTKGRVEYFTAEELEGN